ncbi:MAG: excinuclease ABC subunit UvrA, partial [bacterium]|nr:excinuclease ABC subunit UvrA [bacterium]
MVFPEAQFIKVYGARQHNLKNIDVIIPKNKFVVITGVSGSGKSSLAFDTIYAEGQRRYVESLSPYARQFLEQLQKPDCDKIEGLSPAIAIEPKTISHNPRSTVGTQTEIYDFMRLLFARIGIPYCPNCNIKLKKQSVQEIVESIYKIANGKVKILAPVVRSRIGIYDALFSKYEKMGFTKVRVDGKFYRLSKPPNLSRYKKHTIEVVIDELELNDKERLSDSITMALKEASGIVVVKNAKKEYLYSERSACPKCGFNFPELEPRLFSFNSPYGSCPDCSGLGFKLVFDESLIVPDENISISEGAIKPFAEPITTRTHRWKAS